MLTFVEKNATKTVANILKLGFDAENFAKLETAAGFEGVDFERIKKAAT